MTKSIATFPAVSARLESPPQQFCDKASRIDCAPKSHRHMFLFLQTQSLFPALQGLAVLRFLPHNLERRLPEMGIAQNDHCHTLIFYKKERSMLSTPVS